jgi:hypothetical protein
MAIKNHGIKLQNYIGEVANYYVSSQYMVDRIEAELEDIRYRCVVDADALEEVGSKAASIKEAYGKSQIKYEIHIPSPLGGSDSFLEDLKGSFTYGELKKVLAVYKFKLAKVKSKHEEIRSIIDYCKVYPIKIY